MTPVATNLAIYSNLTSLLLSGLAYIGVVQSELVVHLLHRFHGVGDSQEPIPDASVSSVEHKYY